MTVAFTGYRPEKMPFIESKSDENYMRFRKRQLQVPQFIQRREDGRKRPAAVMR